MCPSQVPASWDTGVCIEYMLYHRQSSLTLAQAMEAMTVDTVRAPSMKGAPGLYLKLYAYHVSFPVADPNKYGHSFAPGHYVHVTKEFIETWRQHQQGFTFTSGFLQPHTRAEGMTAGLARSHAVAGAQPEVALTRLRALMGVRLEPLSPRRPVRTEGPGYGLSHIRSCTNAPDLQGAPKEKERLQGLGTHRTPVSHIGRRWQCRIQRAGIIPTKDGTRAPLTWTMLVGTSRHHIPISSESTWPWPIVPEQKEYSSASGHRQSASSQRATAYP